MKISAASQDYLEALLELSEETHSVRSIDVAKRLSVSRASVNKAMGVLKESGFVLQEKYTKITLTEEGIRAAKAVLRRHSLLKMFLTQVLKVQEETAEIDACRMEHVISVETLEKLQKFLEEKNLL